MNTESILFSDIKAILHRARSRAAAAVNSTMVQAYWLIGQRIIHQEQNNEQRAAYGEGLIKRLSAELTGQFGNGFSIASLKSFRQFYLTFPDMTQATTFPNLSWSHYRLIMRVNDPDARLYYLLEASSANWNVRQLDRNIQSMYYQRIQHTLPPPAPAPASRETDGGPAGIFKDPYVFEFLNMPQPFQGSEKDIESTLIAHLQHFLLELGKGFAFVGRQLRLSTETSDFYVDLVFYNYLLKCFILFDLKLGRLSHADVGQMDMYVRMFDDLKKGNGDQPTLGVILCTDKDETVVRYSVLSDNQRLFAARYRLYLPSEAELIAEIERGRQVHRFRLEESR